MNRLVQGLSALIWLGCSQVSYSACTGQKTAQDYDGDGCADIFWRHAASGENILWLSSDNFNRDRYLPKTQGWSPLANADFDADGQTDLLWHNPLTDEIAIQFVRQAKVTGEWVDSAPPVGWQMLATGDVNADGRADIFWRNAQTGENALYIKTASGFQVQMLATVADRQWQLVALADLNADGRADAVWRNAQTGENYLWLLNGNQITTEHELVSVALDWQIQAVVDMNADGKADLLWRNLNTGQLYVFFMDGFKLLSEQASFKVADLNWQIQAAADYNGDGKTDLFWNNLLTGDNVILLMNGANLQQERDLLQVPSASAWLPVQFKLASSKPVTACNSQQLFVERVWPSIFSDCQLCHVSGGISGYTGLVFSSDKTASPSQFQAWLSAYDKLSSVLATKPQGVVHGGGQRFAPNSAQDKLWQSFLNLMAKPENSQSCRPQATNTGLSVLDPQQTLRKASLQLAGRVPSAAELTTAATDTGNLDKLDALLLAMMDEPAFYQRLKEVFNDMLLTNKFRFEAGHNLISTLPLRAAAATPNVLLKLSYCDPVVWQNSQENTNTAESRTCIQASDALAREPLEMIAYIVKKKASLGEMLTGQYRYLNVFAAKLFGLDLTPFAGHENDPEFWLPVSIPEMHAPNGLAADYAGIITTNAFLNRYPSSSSNRNRSRAYHYNKFFLGKDVMKGAARLDLSSINFSSNPWLTNPQCQGCHQSIDPVAGAFQHWTHCYGGGLVTYFPERYCHGAWYPASEMLAPGSSANQNDQFDSAQLQQPLKTLGERSVNDPAFARAIAGLWLSALTGRPLLDAPVDNQDPDFSSLQQAYQQQQTLLDQLASQFQQHQLELRQLILAIVKSNAFRANNSTNTDLSQLGLGGGTLTTPENIHRKVQALFGAPWALANSLTMKNPSLQDPPDYLLAERRFRVFSGGINSDNINKRSVLATNIQTASLNRMALEMSCYYSAYDFATDAAQRRLFPKVERNQLATGKASDADQQAILANLQYLHLQFWGEQLSTSDPELLASYQLLSQLAVQAKAAGANLSNACIAKTHYATGIALAANRQFSDDANGMVRAWQGLLTYLMLDARFQLEL